MFAIGVPDTLQEMLLFSLKRDAFVMETGAYKNPALAQQTEFERLYPPVHRQLQCLFGADILSFFAVDAQIKDGDSQPARQMVLGYHWAKDADSFPVFCRLGAPQELLPLGDVLRAPDQVVPHYSSGQFPVKSVFDEWKAVAGGGQLAVAPYVVRPVLRQKPPRRLLEVLQLMESEDAIGFLQTSAFEHVGSERRDDWSDAYYVAALLVFAPRPASFTPGLLHWLEAVHISFQLSWGFPVLADQRQLAQDIGDHNERLIRVRDIAKKVSETLQDVVLHETNKILRELERGEFVDRADLKDLYDSRKREVYVGRGYTITTLHDAAGDIATRNFLAYILHRVCGRTPTADMTQEELYQSAVDVLNAQATPWPAFKRLLLSLLESPVQRFYVLKELCLNVHGRRGVSFYSLAVRFLMSQGAEAPLKVAIRSHKGGEWHLTLASLDVYELTGDLSYENPKFPNMNKMQKVWVIPLVRLVEALQIKSSKQHVCVSEVVMEDRARAPVVISLKLDAPSIHGAMRQHYIDHVHARFDAAVDSPDGNGDNDFRLAAAAVKAAIVEMGSEVQVNWPEKSDIIQFVFNK